MKLSIHPIKLILINRISNFRRQRGSVVVMTAVILLFLLGFVGIALDFGHLFVVKTELQTAIDSCALAAAQELDGTTSAISRGKNAGVTAGNQNRVNMQSATWSGQGKLIIGEVTFRDTGYAATTDPVKATYAQCQHTQAAIAVWLIKAMGLFAGSANATAYSSTQNVGASAVATRASAQTACPVPVALKPKTGGTAPDYGYQVGEWVTVGGSQTSNSGGLGWYNVNNNNNYSTSSETCTEFSEGGPCGTKIGDSLFTSGSQASVDTAWNYRFGIYKSGDPGPSVNHPDVTGYAYTSTNWTNAVPQNAYAGTKAANSDPTAANYLTKSATFASFDDTGTSVSQGSTIAFGNSYQFNTNSSLATPGSTGQHANYGYKRRLVTVPIIDGYSKVIGFACMFMLDPLTGSYSTYGSYNSAHLEYRGNSANSTVPCTSSGLAGGSGGPLVSVLVR